MQRHLISVCLRAFNKCACAACFYGSAKSFNSTKNFGWVKFEVRIKPRSDGPKSKVTTRFSHSAHFELCILNASAAKKKRLVHSTEIPVETQRENVRAMVCLISGCVCACAAFEECMRRVLKF